MEDYLMPIISEDQLAKIANIESIYVPYPNIQIAKNKLREVLKLNGFLAEPECVLLTGNSGSGKTSFIKQFVSHYPVIYDDEVDIRTVIYVEIPSQASIKDLCIVILKAFDDPVDNSKLTKLVLSEKVINFAKLAKTKLLILDEFQHLTEKSTLTKVDNLANWIKNFINVTKIPVLIVGMPESEYVLSENTQLSRRFYTR
jgi:Cdc6-like AAA superfamily ATPase